ncbi:sensor histidine kinase [Phytoactinopolyspora halotolerans]|uniref:sensor histidine kinase n=1 Tax=Phytoactinopolyspora halotolerans TaxID=1981512 RepID=UPI001C202624|nr:HAMP domain-containing sensor histidine kinase [Phytoactinopolyspora halotolerans]
MLGAAAIGLVVAGGLSYLVQRERVDNRIDENLAQEVEEFRGLAESGVDPQTAAPFTSVDRLLFVALQRNVPGANEGMLGLVDGEVAWVPSSADLRLQDDAPLLGAVAEQGPEAGIRARTVDGASGSLRYVAVPVTVSGDPATGMYVVAYSRDREHADLVDSYRTYVLAAGASLLLIGGVAWAVVGRLLAPLRLLRETAQRISDTDLSGRIPVDGGDDVSRLGHTVNEMLDRLEAGFNAQREALDDAGHELRTPITIIRGHLELMDAADPDDVAETRDLALDELDRMHRLVEDLILLAKSQRPDFVRPQPVELGRLVDDVLDKAQGMGERRWAVDTRAEALVELDEQRITQALLQLVSNALAVTDTDDTVAIGSEIDPGRAVRLWIRDSGPGIDPAQAESIFERFAHGNSRRHDGSGLGLAIVRAIAEAHHGSATVRSTPGYGSVFTIELPAVRIVSAGRDDDITTENTP